MSNPPAPIAKAPPAPALASTATTKAPTFKVRSSKGPATKGKKTLYWGDSGNGKTTRVITWPGLVVINWDPNRSTLEASPSEFPVIDCLDEAIGIGVFEQHILPMIEKRTIVDYIRGMEIDGGKPFASYPIKTFALDSWTGLQKEVLKSLAGKFFGKNGKEDTQSMWGEFLRKMNRIALAFANLSDPKDGNSYHHVATVHETIKMVKDDDGNESILKIHPSIPGQFGINGEIFQYYDNVFFVEKYITDKPEVPNGPPMKRANYRCWTIAPDRYRKGPKAILNVGSTTPLPTHINGDYPELCRLWGITE